MIRKYLPGDEEGITSLFREVFRKDMDVGQWRWKYLSTQHRPYSKIAQDDTGRIIGHAGAIRLRGILEGRPIPFFQIVDVMVHPEYRGYMGRRNLFGSIMRGLFEEIARDFDTVLCYGFPGRRPYILGERMGIYEAVEEAVEIIIRPQKRWAPMIGLRQVDWGDGRLEDLWKTIQGEYRLSLIRDSHYLQWRYASNPFFSYRLLGLFILGRLKGWFVIRQEGKKVLIIDLLVKRKHLGGALRAISNYFASEEGTSIHLWLPRGWRACLDAHGEERTGVIVTNMIWQLPLKTSLLRERLYYTMGDTDIL